MVFREVEHFNERVGHRLFSALARVISACRVSISCCSAISEREINGSRSSCTRIWAISARRWPRAFSSSVIAAPRHTSYTPQSSRRSDGRRLRRSVCCGRRFCSFSIRSARSASWSSGWSSTFCFAGSLGFPSTRTCSTPRRSQRTATACSPRRSRRSFWPRSSPCRK